MYTDADFRGGKQITGLHALCCKRAGESSRPRHKYIYIHTHTRESERVVATKAHVCFSSIRMMHTLVYVCQRALSGCMYPPPRMVCDVSCLWLVRARLRDRELCHEFSIAGGLGFDTLGR